MQRWFHSDMAVAAGSLGGQIEDIYFSKFGPMSNRDIWLVGFREHYELLLDSQ